MSSPASLALALAAAEDEGWRATAIRAAGDQVSVTVEKVRRVLPREVIAARIPGAEREQGLSLRTIARNSSATACGLLAGPRGFHRTVARVGRRQPASYPALARRIGTVRDMKLVTYCRTSTKNGAGQDSLGAQADACQAWAAEHGHEIVVLERDDGLSGGSRASAR